MMGWYSGGMGWGDWIVMTVAMVAFWTLVVFAIVWIFRGTSQSNGPRDRSADRDPLEILRERFARGEIGEDEFQARSEVLRAHPR